MNERSTLTVIAEAIATLTSGSHLPTPGTVIVGKDHATILPEMEGAPITGLLVWCLHLDGVVHYEAARLWSDPSAPTTVKASGKLDGIDVTIAATTMRAMDKLRDEDDGTGWPQGRKCTEMELRELASNEAVLGVE